MSVRTATPSDATAMGRVAARAMRDGGREAYDDAALDALVPDDPAAVVDDAAFVDGDCHLVVAEVNGAVVGWGEVRTEAGVLSATFVDPAHAGEGIGRRLVAHLERAAASAGCEGLTVPASLNAVGFYERLGYDRVGRIDAGGPDDPEVPSIRLRKRF